MIDGQCAATRKNDCRRSRACREDGRCGLDRWGFMCVDDRTRRSKGLMAAGIVGTSLGGLGLIGGVVWLVGAASAAQQSVANDTGEKVVGPIVLMVGGAATLSLSIIGLVHGAQKVDASERLDQVSLVVTPTGAGFNVRF